MECILKGTTLKPVLLCGQSCNIPFCSNIPFLKGNITLLCFAVICNKFAKLSVKKTLSLAKCTEFAMLYQDHLLWFNAFEWLHCLGSSTFARCRQGWAHPQLSGQGCTVASRLHLFPERQRFPYFPVREHLSPRIINICIAALFIFSLIHLAQCACIIALARLNPAHLATAVQAVGVKAWLIRSPRTEHGEGHCERSGYWFISAGGITL